MITNTATPLVAVYAETNSTATLYEGTDEKGTGTSAAGVARVRVSPALTDGDHTLTATATDLAGNTSTGSPALIFKVDATPPEVSVPDLVDDDGDSSSDNYTSAPRPRFTFATEANAVVTLFENGVALGSATADSNGVATVSVRGDVWLDPGQHCLYAIGLDWVGNASGATSDLCVTIAPGVAPFTSNLGVVLTAEYLLLSVKSTLPATASVRVLHKGKVVATAKHRVGKDKATKLRLHLKPRVRKARKLVVVATMRAADGRKVVVRRVVFRR
jgi:hypothetical protein